MNDAGGHYWVLFSCRSAVETRLKRQASKNVTSQTWMVPGPPSRSSRCRRRQGCSLQVREHALRHYSSLQNCHHSEGVALSNVASPSPTTLGPLIAGLAIKFVLPQEVAADEQLHFADVKSALGGRDSGVGYVEYTPVSLCRIWPSDFACFWLQPPPSNVHKLDNQ